MIEVADRAHASDTFEVTLTEHGFVLLRIENNKSVRVVMTKEAAREMGQSLIEAATQETASPETSG